MTPPTIAPVCDPGEADDDGATAEAVLEADADVGGLQLSML